MATVFAATSLYPPAVAVLAPKAPQSVLIRVHLWLLAVSVVSGLQSRNESLVSPANPVQRPLPSLRLLCHHKLPHHRKVVRDPHRQRGARAGRDPRSRKEIVDP